MKIEVLLEARVNEEETSSDFYNVRLESDDVYNDRLILTIEESDGRKEIASVEVSLEEFLDAVRRFQSNSKSE